MKPQHIAEGQAHTRRQIAALFVACALIGMALGVATVVWPGVGA